MYRIDSINTNESLLLDETFSQASSHSLPEANNEKSPTLFKKAKRSASNEAKQRKAPNDQKKLEMNFDSQPSTSVVNIRLPHYKPEQGQGRSSGRAIINVTGELGTSWDSVRDNMGLSCESLTSILNGQGIIIR